MASEQASDPRRPNFDTPWLERWREADFSWLGIGSHSSWLSHGGSLQDYLRALDNGASDENLTQSGALLECDARQYHVLFIPPEWAESHQVDVTTEELARRKQYYWNKILTNGGLRDTSRGTITGAFIPTDVEQRLVTSFRVSFEWIEFRGVAQHIPRRGDRFFTNCLFTDEVRFHGAIDPTDRSTLHFTWCEFIKPIKAQQFSGLELLDINDSLTHQLFEISESSLNKLRLDDCRIASLSITDTVVSGQLTIGNTSIGWLEWINCTFEAHVLFVGGNFQDSVGWLACDFRSRVTLADMAWPDSAFQAASASGSKFDGIVEITGGAPPPVQLFQEAEFRSKVSLNSFSDQIKRESFRTELEAMKSRQAPGFNPQDHAQNVESGCRTLRKVAEAAGDVQSEQLWHRAELLARRARGDSDTSETGFSLLYELLADYGLSISRPFVVLFFSTLTFALIYAWIGGPAFSGKLDLRSLEEGLGYSLNRTIPIGVFGEEHNAWRNDLLGNSGRLRDIAVRVIATSQTVFSAVLIYLGVMAIRRKFRIS